MGNRKKGEEGEREGERRAQEEVACGSACRASEWAKCGVSAASRRRRLSGGSFKNRNSETQTITVNNPGRG